jgi:SAM-dependent methyltransferase
MDAISDPAQRFRTQRIEHWNRLASDQSRSDWSGYYHRRLADVYRALILPGQRVLEIGCGQGDLLAALSPADGVGLDFSPEMILRARRRHPDLQFIVADAHDLALADKTFDYIILSDVINDLWDVQQVIERVAAHCGPTTRVVLNFFSHLWEPPLRLMRALGLARPVQQQNWLTREDVTSLLELAGFSLVRSSVEFLWPIGTPGLAPLLNRIAVKVWPFRVFALSHVLVARLANRPRELAQDPLVTVVVPARNEAGNVEQVFSRVPEMGAGTELIFVEGHSTDDTYRAVEAAMRKFPQVRSRLLRQEGKGKGDAVRLGFAHARGQVLMILDADLTVPPESLPKFYRALRLGRGDFINGVRLVYPMEAEAMRFFNLVGNKFFSLAFSWLLGQPIKDTLCGTKVLWKSDYETIAANRSYFGEFDPFGDYDLLFGAVRLNLKIIDLPVRYQARTYGETNIQRWRHGALLLRMVMFAARKIKFV